MIPGSGWMRRQGLLWPTGGYLLLICLQPGTISPCGRLVLSYNGEIYNHLDIRKELDQQGGVGSPAGGICLEPAHVHKVQGWSG